MRKCSFRTLVVSYVVVCLAACSDSTAPANKGPWQIVFVQQSQSCCTNLAIISSDGAGLRQLTTSNSQVGDWEPTWSPDGNKIAFTRGSTVSIISADGSTAPTLLATGASAPTWSSDGSRLAFRMYPRDSVMTMRSDGGDIHSTGLFLGYDSHMSWSRSGRFAYPCAVIAYMRGEICTAKADGSDVRKLTGTESGNIDPDWSPDGKQIAFARDSRIWIMNADGSNPSALTPVAVATRYPKWSPDGRSISYQRWNQAMQSEIHIISIDGTGDRFLANGFLASWNPK